MSHDYEYVPIGPGDDFAVAPSPDGELGVRIRQGAFVEPDRWLVFGSGFDDVRRMRELAGALHELARRTEASRSTQ